MTKAEKTLSKQLVYNVKLTHAQRELLLALVKPMAQTRSRNAPNINLVRSLKKNLERAKATLVESRAVAEAQ